MTFIYYSLAPRVAMSELKNYDPSQIVAPKYVNPEKLPEFWREILRLPLKPIQERENRAVTGFEPITTAVTPSIPTLSTSEQPVGAVVVTCSNTNLPTFTVIMFKILIFLGKLYPIANHQEEREYFVYYFLNFLIIL